MNGQKRHHIGLDMACLQSYKTMMPPLNAFMLNMKRIQNFILKQQF
jgi:hypothetical protein